MKQSGLRLRVGYPCYNVLIFLKKVKTTRIQDDSMSLKNISYY